VIIKREEMKTLAPGYVVQIDRIGPNDWSEILPRFDDATIYQTWSYGSVRWGQDHLSHVVLKRDGEVVGAAQARIIKIPILGAGIAYIPFGPLWRLHGRQKDLGSFQQVVRALYNEYVLKQGLLLRVIPNEINDDADMIHSILQEEGLVWRESIPSYRTFLIDLSLPSEQLRKSLDQKWRNCLNRAGKNGLRVVEGFDDNLYNLFSNIYEEMHERKKFFEFVDINKMRAVQKDLQDHFKMTIMLCEFEAEPVSAVVCTAIGDTGIYLLGATNDKGRTLQASYLVQWRVIEWLKARGCRWYDLGGIDPEKNPGTYHFKAGLSGRLGKEVRYLGQFDGCRNLLSSFLVKVGDELRANSPNLKHTLEELKIMASQRMHMTK
jgi:lipid II:glycine glycyltransferase (peptidoglycan interpeptide bridge formation enzyme)